MGPHPAPGRLRGWGWKGKAAGAVRLVLGMDGPGLLAALGDVCRVQAALEGCGGCGVSLCCSFCMRRGIVAGPSPLCAALQPAEGRGWGLGTRMPKAALPGPPPSAPLLRGPSGACSPHPRGAGGCCAPTARGEMGSSSPALKLLSPGQAGPALAESHPCHIDRRGLLSMHSTRRGISPLRLPPARPPRAPSCSTGCGFLLALLGTAPRSRGVPGAGSPAPRCCHLRAWVVRSWGSPGGVAIGPSPPAFPGAESVPFDAFFWLPCSLILCLCSSLTLLPSASIKACRSKS